MQNITYQNPTNVNLETGFNYPGDASLSFRFVLFKASDGTTQLLPLDTTNLFDYTMKDILLNQSAIFNKELLGEIEEINSNETKKNKLTEILNNVNKQITKHFTITGGSRKLNKYNKSKKSKKSKSRKH